MSHLWNWCHTLTSVGHPCLIPVYNLPAPGPLPGAPPAPGPAPGPPAWFSCPILLNGFVFIVIQKQIKMNLRLGTSCSHAMVSRSVFSENQSWNIIKVLLRPVPIVKSSKGSMIQDPPSLSQVPQLPSRSGNLTTHPWVGMFDISAAIYRQPINH